MLERRRGEGRSPEVTVAEKVTLKAECGQPRQHRQDARAVVRIGGLHSRSSSEPCLSQTANSFTPLTSLPPSMSRTQAVGAERSERLSATTAEGRTSSPQARRQSSARRWPSRRQSPKRVQRAKLLCRVVKGTPESQLATCHCKPLKVSVQISPIRRRRRARGPAYGRGGARPPVRGPWPPTRLRPRRRRPRCWPRCSNCHCDWSAEHVGQMVGKDWRHSNGCYNTSTQDGQPRPLARSMSRNRPNHLRSFRVQLFNRTGLPRC